MNHVLASFGGAGAVIVKVSVESLLVELLKTVVMAI